MFGEKLKIYGRKIICPKHGVHEHIIESTIENHEGLFCQICWLDGLVKCELYEEKE